MGRRRTPQDAAILASQINTMKAGARAHALKAGLAAKERAEALQKLMEQLEKQKVLLMDQISNVGTFLVTDRDEWRRSLADIDLAAAGAHARLQGLLETIERHIHLYYSEPAGTGLGGLLEALKSEPSPLIPAKVPKKLEKLPRSFVAIEVEQRQRERKEESRKRRERARRELAPLEQGLKSLISGVAAYDARRSSP